MPARRKLSPRQVEILVEFAESHREIALGRFSGGPLANQATRKAWQEVAVKLNSVAEGSTKTADQWRRYWIEFKAKTKTKAADSRRNASATGGGPNKLLPLNDLEQRILNIIGPVAVEGLPGVRIPFNLTAEENPSQVIVKEFTKPSTSTAQTTTLEPPMEIEWLEYSPPPLEFQMSPGTSHPDTHSLKHDNKELFEEKEQQQTISQNAPKRKTKKRISQDERVPRWAYELERKRLAVEERHTAAIENLALSLTKIQEDLHKYISTLK